MRIKKTPNIDFIVGMAENFVNCRGYRNFTHDFIKKYDAICREDEVYENIINHNLFEKKFDNHRDNPEDKLRKIMSKAVKEFKSDSIM